MRFIKAQTTSRGINADTKGINIDSLGLVEVNTDKAMIVPKGAEARRPFTAQEGMLRYNTDEQEFEVYHQSAWKPIRFREPVTITQQNLGNGDGTETVFGPLDSGDAFYPIPVSENNILVTIENVFQLATTNYTIQQSSGGSLNGPNSPYADGYYLVFGTPVPTGKPVQVLHNFDK
jgi:ribosomal protein L11 methylase PrmA